ncbi:amidase [Henriciella sp. AS95]|uniref:amidase n=1 Tax=Henriciella sp. AS95 TaxID=3135782 RepID=UPI00316F162E
MMPASIVGMDIAGLSSAFREGDLTPVDVFEAYAERIAAYDPLITAFVGLRLDEARQEADASARRWSAGTPLSPIDGIPIAVKANIAVEGLACHAGIEAYRNDVAVENAEVVDRLVQAGAIMLGTLNMHEGALGATTDNPAFGRTLNPRNLAYTPGGSSGGSGAAIAAGLAAGALGSDTMGSVRIPSAYCGCVGHKPSPGIIPTDGIVPLSTTLDHVGPHARSVEDLEILMGVLSAGFTRAEPPKIENVRVGVWNWQGKVDVEAAVSDGFSDALERLAAAGLQTCEVEPPDYVYGKDRRAGLLVSEREAAAVHADRLKVAPDGFSAEFKAMMAWGAKRPAEEYDACLARFETLRASASRLFETVDFVVSPVAPQPAFKFGDKVPANQADFTAWANFAGLPATAVPTGASAAGLPLALQIIGPAGSDAETLAFARIVEGILGRLPVATPAI